jgi:adenylylsulfate kinase
MFKETKNRTIMKAITWRVVATLNSYIILILFITTGSLWKAIFMNITGFFIFYIFERVWNKIKWGRIKE